MGRRILKVITWPWPRPFQGRLVVRRLKLDIAYSDTIFDDASYKHLKYKERLMRLQLPTLRYRLLRGDMIEVYKILTNKYDTNINFRFEKQQDNVNNKQENVNNKQWWSDVVFLKQLLNVVLCHFMSFSTSVKSLQRHYKEFPYHIGWRDDVAHIVWEPTVSTI